MLKEIRTNSIILSILLLLIVASYSLAEIGAKANFSVIGSLSALKFLAVSFQFMETKKANPLWKIVIGLFVITFLIAVFVSE